MVLSIDVQTAHGIIDHHDPRREFVVSKRARNEECKRQSSLVALT